MSTTHSTIRRTPLAHRIAAGALILAILAAITVLAWPASEAEKARDDGEAFGAAVSTLYEADTPEEIDDARADVRAAAEDTAAHADDALDEHVTDQADALDRTVDGFVGMHTADTEWDQDLYEAELDAAVDDLTSQADHFRSEAPEVEQAFWEGVEDGLETES
jgi:hypothetical protein